MAARLQCFCVNSAGNIVEILIENEEQHTEEEHNHEEEEHAEGEICHFHAGVEHCVGAGAEEETAICARTDRDYNKDLRVGLLFVILATSAIGVFSPMLASSFARMSQKKIIFVVLKQFGTGVVLSTAFIHLFTHAGLIFAKECLGELAYEGTTAAVFLAGLFLSFLVDYLGARFILWRQSKKSSSDPEMPVATSNDRKLHADVPNAAVTHRDERGSHVHMHGNMKKKLNVLVLEAGIIFHSLRMSLYSISSSLMLTHLGTCIAGLPSTAASLTSKLLMATGFALVTPIGMAIGIGALDKFNGNDPSTLIAIGTLDALSAGILAWVGILEMLAKDWMYGNLLNAGAMKTEMGMTALVAGLILMSLLGKWA